MSHDYNTLCEAAAALARSGGRMAAEALGLTPASLKADRSWVTEMDHAVQDHILRAIAERFKGHGAVGEEDQPDVPGLAPVTEAEYVWIIDPIDGTRNYVRSFPVFSTTIAVLHRGEPVAAATFDPLTDRLYSAIRGGGAFLDGKRLSVADGVEDVDRLIGVPSERRVTPPEAVQRWSESAILRCTGSTALHIAMVAAGCLDAAYGLDTKIWDIAAGALLVTEAGGVVTDVTGRPIFPFDATTNARDPVPFLAAGTKLHAELLQAFV